MIEVEDDGGGIDVGRVRQVAADRGVAAPDVLAAMSEDEIVDLIFAPGFSTAAAVTNLSGRGVGMDAVRTAVERLGGRVQVENRPGEGALVRFTLPFAVMISRVLTVEAGGDWFGIPMDAVIGDGARSTRFDLAGRCVPRLRPAQPNGAAHRPGRGAWRRREDREQALADANVVVTFSGGQIAGLEVDED